MNFSIEFGSGFEFDCFSSSWGFWGSGFFEGSGGGPIECLAVVGSDSSWIIGSGSANGLRFRGDGGPPRQSWLRRESEAERCSRVLMRLRRHSEQC